MWYVENTARFMRQEAKSIAKNPALHLPVSSIATKLPSQLAETSTSAASSSQAAAASAPSVAPKSKRCTLADSPGAAAEREAALVIWEKLEKFSYRHMQDIFEEDAPVTWHLLSTYANSPYTGEGVTTVRKYRT